MSTEHGPIYQMILLNPTGAVVYNARFESDEYPLDAFDLGWNAVQLDLCFDPTDLEVLLCEGD